MLRTFSISLLFVLLVTSLITAQKTNSSYLEISGIRSSFQDTKFSDNHYRGFGANLNIGFEQQTSNAIWGAEINIDFLKEKPSTHKSTKVTSFAPGIQAKYLRKVNDKIFLGGKWNIIGVNFRTTSGLGNNSSYHLASSDFLLSGLFRHGKWTAGADLGFLSFMKESTSFAFNAPQNILENGDFDYQDDALSNPFGFKYYVPRSINKHFILVTNVGCQITDRLAVGYEWRMRRYVEVEKYPATKGSSKITFRWNFTHKVKGGDTEETPVL